MENISPTQHSKHTSDEKLNVYLRYVRPVQDLFFQFREFLK